MKIFYIGGNAPRLVNLMSDMRDRGHEVHWIALSVPKYVIPDITVHNDIIIGNLSFVKRYVNLPYYYFILKTKIRHLSPDLIHAINVKWAGWFSVFSGFKNVIVTPQGGDIMVRSNSKNGFFYNFLRKYTIRNATVVTYGNNTMLKYINYWAKSKKTFQYFAGVNFEVMNYKVCSRELCQKLNINNRKVIFSPRMFEQNSNLDTVLKTIPLVKKRFPNVLYIFTRHLEINNYSLQVKKLIKRLDIAENCLILDEIKPDEMANYYSIADVVVSILSSDGMPATLLESMAMKKPMVISKIPSYLGLMNEKYAQMVDFRNKNETASAFIKALTQDREIDQMTKIAYDWVTKNANFRKLNDSLEKLYLEIIN